MKTGTCRHCGLPILLIETAKGPALAVDPVPMDFVPDLNGPNWYVVEGGYILHGIPLMIGENEHTETGYISHFATCPKRQPRQRSQKRRDTP